MKPHPTPTAPGHYWAKLVHPNRMPEGHDWASLDWEVVQVFENGGTDPAFFLGVHVPGVPPIQWVEDFVWGPQVHLADYLGSGVTMTLPEPDFELIIEALRSSKGDRDATPKERSLAETMNGVLKRKRSQ